MQLSRNTPLAGNCEVILSMYQDNVGVLASVYTSGNSKLQEHFRGHLAMALRRAEKISLEGGSQGFYDIIGIDKLEASPTTELIGVLPELNRQIDTLQQRARVRRGPNPNWSAGEVALLSPARAHLGKLIEVRDLVSKRLPPTT